MKSCRLRARVSFFLGIRAVCGIGNPRGCRNNAVTANQSAMAPTIEASAPALTNPQTPSLPNVRTKTTAANPSSASATRRIWRNPRRRCSSPLVSVTTVTVDMLVPFLA